MLFICVIFINAQEAPIYLDYNATTPLSREASEAMRPYLDQLWGREGEEMGAKRREGEEGTRREMERGRDGEGDSRRREGEKEWEQGGERRKGKEGEGAGANSERRREGERAMVMGEI